MRRENDNKDLKPIFSFRGDHPVQATTQNFDGNDKKMITRRENDNKDLKPIFSFRGDHLVQATAQKFDGNDKKIITRRENDNKDLKPIFSFRGDDPIQKNFDGNHKKMITKTENDNKDLKPIFSFRGDYPIQATTQKFDGNDEKLASGKADDERNTKSFFSIQGDQFINSKETYGKISKRNPLLTNADDTRSHVPISKVQQKTINMNIVPKLIDTSKDFVGNIAVQSKPISRDPLCRFLFKKAKRRSEKMFVKFIAAFRKNKPKITDHSSPDIKKKSVFSGETKTSASTEPFKFWREYQIVSTHLRSQSLRK